jgi:hypothetical protein
MMMMMFCQWMKRIFDFGSGVVIYSEDFERTGMELGSFSFC